MARPGSARFLRLTVTALFLAAGCGHGTLQLGDIRGDDDAGDDDAGDDDSGDNLPPSAPGVTIQPEEPSGGDALTCQVVDPAVDPDGDALTYRYAWLVHGNPTNLVSETVPADYTSQGDEWVCEVVAHDGQMDGPPGSASVTIGFNEFELVQSLEGGPASIPCPDCDFTFDVVYTTVSQTGSCDALCGFTFPDGVPIPMGFDESYGMIMMFISYYGYEGWYGWYYAYPSDDLIEFGWYGYGYTQQGYWDVDGDQMTGLAINSEP